MFRETSSQRIGCGDGAEGVCKQQQRRAEQARPEDRQGDHHPVLAVRGAEDFSGLAPFLLHAVERRRQDQHHQRDLEVHVGDGEAEEG